MKLWYAECNGWGNKTKNIIKADTMDEALQKLQVAWPSTHHWDWRIFDIDNGDDVINISGTGSI